MSPDCAVLGCSAGRQATRGGRQRMALFFRAAPRMFFLILLGRGRGEKNYAGFGVVLREFSRGEEWVGLGGGCVAVWGKQRVGGGCGGTQGRRPRGGDGRPSRCWRGFERIEAVSSPFDCTAFRVAWGADVHNGIGLARRGSGRPAPRSDAQGVVPTFEWILLQPVLVPVSGMHRGPSGRGGGISTSKPARVSISG
ncbi:hypothetical protein BLA3211_07142 [Burkholderia aenigmatica]|uniref:Uncharacterized protein n=1 Tax=Burkholderia aenigmatica TaxID=2015348 RepID=A0A6J5JN84_9BURK|nr:hypothetical protein BLA3211_07142 [Burkholderia aenigmatica]